MLGTDRKSNLVEDSLPSNIRSSETLKAISVPVQHGVNVYLMFNNDPWILFNIHSRCYLDWLQRGCWIVDDMVYPLNSQWFVCNMTGPWSTQHPMYIDCSSNNIWNWEGGRFAPRSSHALAWGRCAPIPLSSSVDRSSLGRRQNVKR